MATLWLQICSGACRIAGAKLILMRYIVDDATIGKNFQPYFDYLESVKDRMSEPLYRFASNEENYDLRSHTSLHDAWLEHLTIREIAAGQRDERRSIEIESCYLGPFHDLRIWLTYRGVGAFTLRTPAEFAARPTKEVGHGDLLVHEIRVIGEGLFEHELEFSRGSVFLIQFTELEHRVVPCR